MLRANIKGINWRLFVLRSVSGSKSTAFTYKGKRALTQSFLLVSGVIDRNKAAIIFLPISALATRPEFVVIACCLW